MHLRSQGGICTDVHLEAALSVPYFVDVLVITDRHRSVQPAEWCALLLSPRSNTLAVVEQIRQTGSIVTGLIALGTLLTLFAVALGVSRAISRIAEGLAELRYCGAPALTCEDRSPTRGSATRHGSTPGYELSTTGSS